MNIAIIGTRGIPNRYGGFEQCAEYLADGLSNKGHTVTVYSPSNHPYKKSSWRKVNIVHCQNPEGKLGSAGAFVYDLNCILHARKQNYDIILMLGYTSSSIWGWLFPRKKTIITTNMDGLEWKRSKYSAPVKRFLVYAEKLGVRYSDHLIADSEGIQSYLKEKYSKPSVFIPYGAHIFETPEASTLSKFSLKPFEYDILIARMEPENNIEVILDGVVLAAKSRRFLVIGGNDNRFGKYVKQKFAAYENIVFLGAIYDMNTLNNLRYFSNIYFHGHSVGGTNPSLLEAMASDSFICAHDNIFNRTILKQNAYYFNSAEDVSRVLLTKDKRDHLSFLEINRETIKSVYNWDRIIGQYENHFKQILPQNTLWRSYKKKTDAVMEKP